MASSARFDTNAVAIPGGLASLAIFEHSIVHPEIDLELVVIEKRMPHTAQYVGEFLLYRSLEAATAANTHMGPCPHVLATGESEEYYSVVMPRYKGVGRRIANEDLHGRLIAASVHDLNGLDLASFTRVNMMNVLRRKIERLAGESGQLRSRARQVVRLVDATMPPAWKDELVQSHNDLYFSNIATEEAGDGYNIVLIDFGLSGRNSVGAEFHHFLRGAHLGQVSQPLLDAMIGHYSELCEKPKDLLVFNAYRYALLRSLTRGLVFMRQGQEDRLSEELGIVDAMLHSAHELLDDGPAQQEVP